MHKTTLHGLQALFPALHPAEHVFCILRVNKLYFYLNIGLCPCSQSLNILVTYGRT